MNRLFVSGCLLLGACAHQKVAERVPLADFIARQEPRSWAFMQDNISPREPKALGQPPPLKGIVVAALSKKDPDYYFHWVRDASHVMDTLALALRMKRPYAEREKIAQQFRDYVQLSRNLQMNSSPWSLGEPRFTVTGDVDTLPWSRPQYDGPALRALSLLHYLESGAVTAEDQRALWAVVRTDLNFVQRHFRDRGFDIWEEYNADNYQTRLVQLAALEQGAAWMESHHIRGAEPYKLAARELETLLDDHWDPARGFLRSQLAIVATDGYTAKKTDLDSAVILAVLDADRSVRGHSVMDDRVQATVSVLEDLFRQSYRLNRDTQLGLSYGRYSGDVYYGGNPFTFVTADFARFYYRLARHLRAGQGLAVTPKNLKFLRESLSSKWQKALTVGATLHQEVAEEFQAKGDLILERLAQITPKDGQMYEQFDRDSGAPRSSRGIGWAHSAWLAAIYEKLAGLTPKTP